MKTQVLLDKSCIRIRTNYSDPDPAKRFGSFRIRIHGTDFIMVKAFIVKYFEKFRPDLDPNIFGSCSAPKPDPDSTGHESHGRDLKKVGSDPQHYF